MSGRAVLLTSHVMEEVEALCGRVGIMVGGRFRCLGTPAHLKATHGAHFEMHANVPAGNRQEQFKHAIANAFDGATCIEQHGDSLKYRVPRTRPAARPSTPAVGGAFLPPHVPSVTIGSVFRWVESVKSSLSVTEYSVSETSLEQIFVHYAAGQEEETAKVTGMFE